MTTKTKVMIGAAVVLVLGLVGFLVWYLWPSAPTITYVSAPLTNYQAAPGTSLQSLSNQTSDAACKAACNADASCSGFNFYNPASNYSVNAAPYVCNLNKDQTVKYYATPGMYISSYAKTGSQQAQGMP